MEELLEDPLIIDSSGSNRESGTQLSHDNEWNTDSWR